MIIGIPSEIKDNEFRVSLVPSGAEALTESGHQVLIQAGAGMGTGIEDAEYVDAGAKIVADAETLFATAEMIIKVNTT